MLYIEPNYLVEGECSYIFNANERADVLSTNKGEDFYKVCTRNKMIRYVVCMKAFYTDGDDCSCSISSKSFLIIKATTKASIL